MQPETARGADSEPDLTALAASMASRCERAAYVLVGLGVLAVKKAQVTGRELGLGGPAPDFEASVAQILHGLDERLQPIVARLPAQLRDAVAHARETRDDLRRRAFGSTA